MTEPKEPKKYKYVRGYTYIDRDVYVELKKHCLEIETPLYVAATQAIREYLQKNLPKINRK